MRCPVCRAEVEQGPQCRRCRADLGLLFQLEEQRRRDLSAAYHRLVAGDWRQALALAERAESVRRDEESRRLRAAAHLIGRDFPSAWHVYQLRPAAAQ